MVSLLLLNIESYLLPNTFHRNNIKNKFNRGIIILAVEKKVNETFNSSLENNNLGIKSVEYNEEQELWVIDLESFDLELPEEESSEEESPNSKEDNAFPSFNKFLENRNKKENEITRVYFEKADRKANEIEEDIRNPHSKDLKLLTYYETIEYSKEWIYNMIHNGPSDSFPKFIYDNIYDMREFCEHNQSREYFYVSYVPDNAPHGPYFIGAFELVPNERELNTYLIMQNPKYIISDKDIDINRFINYKKEILRMTYEANVFLKFNRLNQSPACERYYLSWLFEDNG